jgi:adenosylcobyric acid synthase
VEGAGGDEPGLGLLPVETVFSAEKRTAQVRGSSLLPWGRGLPLEGYEIHMGRTSPLAPDSPVAVLAQSDQEPADRLDGYHLATGRIWGCYLHGLFGNDGFRRAWLHSLGWVGTASAPHGDPYDRLADSVEHSLDSSRLAHLLERTVPT